MLWKSGAPRIEPFHHMSKTMPLLYPGLPSSSNRLRMCSPIWLIVETMSGSRFGLTGSFIGGPQIRPGNGLLW